MNKRLGNRYFQEHDALFIARDLLGKNLVRKFDDGTEFRTRIVETEAYLGEEDLACHASKGRTKRTEVLYGMGGHVYVYLIYGMYWLLNVVTGKKDMPQAVLIRGLEGCAGPGRVGKLLKLDQSFYGESLENSKRIWLEDGISPGKILCTPRIGIDYAGEWKEKKWRFLVEN